MQYFKIDSKCRQNRGSIKIGFGITYEQNNSNSVCMFSWISELSMDCNRVIKRTGELF